MALTKTIFKIKEKLIKGVLVTAALVSIVSILFMIFFIFSEGLPLIKKIGLLPFLTGNRWAPEAAVPQFGVLPFIIGTIGVTFLSLLLALPVGISVGIYMSQYAPERVASILRSVVELLAGIPSVVYGLFGYIAIAPFIRRFPGTITGLGMLTGSIILALMILPTLINIIEVSIRAVPKTIQEGSLALGSSRWQSVVKLLIPSAKNGIIAGVILAMGRAIGETMAVLMVAGNSPIMPDGILSHVRTLTMNIATGISYAAGDHWTALFTCGIVLFFFILLLNITIQLITKKSVKDK